MHARHAPARTCRDSERAVYAVKGWRAQAQALADRGVTTRDVSAFVAYWLERRPDETLNFGNLANDILSWRSKNGTQVRRNLRLGHVGGIMGTRIIRWRNGNSRTIRKGQWGRVNVKPGSSGEKEWALPLFKHGRITCRARAITSRIRLSKHRGKHGFTSRKGFTEQGWSMALVGH